MGKTTIEWTATYLPDGTVLPGFTHNPWIGCQPVSSGCANCFARRDFSRYPRWANCWGAPESTERKRTSDANWRKPLAWNRQAEAMGVRRKVLCASLADVFEDAPQVAGWRRDLWALIEDTPWLDWLLLTKRPENILDFAPRFWTRPGELGYTSWPGNAWLGVTTEDQQCFDERWQIVKKFMGKAPVLFFSFEPLLGEIILPGDFLLAAKMSATKFWSITGGESGPNARPSSTNWFRLLCHQSLVSGISFHHKQNGEWLGIDQVDHLLRPGQTWENAGLPVPREHTLDDGTIVVRVGREQAGRRLDGREWDESPDIGTVADGS